MKERELMSISPKRAQWQHTVLKREARLILYQISLIITAVTDFQIQLKQGIVMTPTFLSSLAVGSLNNNQWRQSGQAQWRPSVLIEGCNFSVFILQVFLSVGGRAAHRVIDSCDDAIRYDARRNLRHNFHVAHVLQQALKDVRWGMYIHLGPLLLTWFNFNPI